MAHPSPSPDPDERMSRRRLFRRCGSGRRISPPFRSLGDMVSNVNAVGLVPYGETVVACKPCSTLQTWPAQCITVCSASNRAGARLISSPVQGLSPAKT